MKLRNKNFEIFCNVISLICIACCVSSLIRFGYSIFPIIIMPLQFLSIFFNSDWYYILFETKIWRLTSKISGNNLLLLNDEERNSEYDLEKLYIWQEQYNWVKWDEFRDEWFYCHTCKSYNEGQCICYAR
jgi:hypothetical protein